MSFWQTCIVFLLATVIAAGTVYFSRIVEQPLSVQRQTPWVTYVHPSVEKLEKAQALNDEGKLPEARAILVKTLNAAPRSPVLRELRDLLGEVNTRLFFSEQPSLRKTEYTVAKGDALASIARRLKSSTDAIMRVNGLDSNLIRPGQKLLVPQLDFTITIDLPRDRVVVHDGRGFFTQYPIAAADLPPSRALKVQTEIRAKSFLKNGQPVAHSRGQEKDATPWIFLHRRGYVLYGVEEDDEMSESRIAIEGEEASIESNANRPPEGIAMLKKDIAELELLIDKGTPVTIILDHK